MAKNKLTHTGDVIATTERLGVSYDDSTDFSVADDGKVSLSGTGALESLTSDSGDATPVGGEIDIAGGEGIDTSATGNTLTVAIETATTTNVGGLETATDAEAIAASAVDKIIVPGNLAALTATNLAALTASDSDAQAKTSVAKYLTPANLAAEGFVQFAEVSMTAAEIKALATTPIEMVAAQGAGTVVVFMGAQFKLVYGSEVFTESGDNLGIKYTDASGVQVSDTIECTGFIDQSANTYTSAVPIKDAIVAATGAENQALVLDNLGNNFGGNASNDSTLEVSIQYRVISI